LFLNDILKHNGKIMNQEFKLIKAQDYLESGVIVYPKGASLDFMGCIETQRSAIRSMGESFRRPEISFAIVCYGVTPALDDVVVDDAGTRYIVSALNNEKEVNQNKWLKSGVVSTKWFIGVSG